MNKIYSIIAFLCCITLSGFSQDFFADEAEDTIPKKFYEQERSLSLFYTLGYPNDNVGFTAVIHNTKDRFSYYASVRTNMWEQYFVTGYSVDSSSSVRQSTSFNQTTLTFGLGGAPLPNMLLFGALGATYRYTSLQTEQYADRGILFTNPKNKFALALDAGLMYITPFDISFLIGADVFNKKVLLGLGYAF